MTDILAKLNAPITNTEIKKVIKSLANNKSPVTDRFSAEYYKACGDILLPHLTLMFNTAASCSFFLLKMLQTVIITLSKLGKVPNRPKNFRPISLLNTDLKMDAKIIANTLAEVTPLPIKED